MSNYYDLLGVSKDASEKDIRQAYRRLARQYHPDVNRDDAAAEEKFKEINEAYGILSDEDSRKKYDRYGDNWQRAEEYDAAKARGPAGGGFRWTSDNADFGRYLRQFCWAHQNSSAEFRRSWWRPVRGSFQCRAGYFSTSSSA